MIRPAFPLEYATIPAPRSEATPSLFHPPSSAFPEAGRGAA
jgi:hypothetical protein